MRCLRCSSRKRLSGARKRPRISGTGRRSRSTASEERRRGTVGMRTKVGGMDQGSNVGELTKGRRIWRDGCTGGDGGCCEDARTAGVRVWVWSWGMMRVSDGNVELGG